VPDFKKIAQVSQKYKTIGYHLFTLDTKQGVMANCRNFAPLYDIPEESATGTSNGALTCYLHKYKKIALSSDQPYIFRQGDNMNRPSTIFTKIKWSGDHIQKIEAGGTASNIQKRLLSLS
jgi:PhzF family phenazine biosynthesis protein